MKKYLPTSINFSVNKSGFTLVELLVVITIIAILSVIGITIFTGVQKNARDAQRRGDVDAISKAWEVHYSQTTPNYPALQATWFSNQSIPRDPLTNVAYDYSGGAANESASGATYKVCATIESSTGTFCKSNQQ